MALLHSFLALAAVTLATWNGKWFPSGRAEHRASPEVEARTVASAGRMIGDAFTRIDPSGTNDIVLCLNEMRNKETVLALAKATGRADLKLAAISAYRRRDRFDQQQDAILTTLPVAACAWSRWRVEKARTPPRGYVYADLVFPGAVTTRVYAVHLKSNYGQRNEADAELNRLKRTAAIEQIVEQEAPKYGKFRRPLILAGDMNADAWQKGSEKELMFPALDKAGFQNVLALLPPNERITLPGSGRWKGSALDYIFLRGLEAKAAPSVVPARGISDHNLVMVPVWTQKTSHSSTKR